MRRLEYRVRHGHPPLVELLAGPGRNDLSPESRSVALPTVLLKLRTAQADLVRYLATQREATNRVVQDGSEEELAGEMTHAQRCGAEGRRARASGTHECQSVTGNAVGLFRRRSWEGELTVAQLELSWRGQRNDILLTISVPAFARQNRLMLCSLVRLYKTT